VAVLQIGEARAQLGELVFIRRRLGRPRRMLACLS
jgi:hypothetical protein